MRQGRAKAGKSKQERQAADMNDDDDDISA
jgi:hypothetical protein